MFDFVDRQAGDYLRRVTVFGRSHGQWQFTIMEMSLMSWTRNCVVVGIDGSAAEVLPFDYPTWLHNLWQAFAAGRPEPKNNTSGKAYAMMRHAPEVRVYHSKASMMEDTGWSPQTETELETFVTISVPAGRQTVFPIALKFARPKNKDENSIWVALPDETLEQDVEVGAVDVFFQNQTDHVPYARDTFVDGGKYTRSQYQACVITRTELCEPMVNPMGDYYRWTVDRKERQSQWITV